MVIFHLCDRLFKIFLLLIWSYYIPIYFKFCTIKWVFIKVCLNKTFYWDLISFSHNLLSTQHHLIYWHTAYHVLVAGLPPLFGPIQLLKYEYIKETLSGRAIEKNGTEQYYDLRIAF